MSEKGRSVGPGLGPIEEQLSLQLGKHAPG
jgi:hypothetical protein